MKNIYLKLFYSISLLFFAGFAVAQCPVSAPLSVSSTVLPNGDVDVTWEIDCANSCDLGVLYHIGFYSNDDNTNFGTPGYSEAPDGLMTQYGFGTYIAPGCDFTQTWEGTGPIPEDYPAGTPGTNPNDAKNSTCYNYLFGQEVDVFSPGFEKSWDKDALCASGAGSYSFTNTIPAARFCTGVEYIVRVHELSYNVAPDGDLTQEDIACLGLLVDESVDYAETTPFTPLPGTPEQITPPTLTVIINGIAQPDANGLVNPYGPIDCNHILELEYAVIPGCNESESVAGYFFTNTGTFTNGTFITPPDFSSTAFDDFAGAAGITFEHEWDIFFANNLVDGDGNSIPYSGLNPFGSIQIDEDTEICLFTQDPCNGTANMTCVQLTVAVPPLQATVTPNQGACPPAQPIVLI